MTTTRLTLTSALFACLSLALVGCGDKDAGAAQGGNQPGATQQPLGDITYVVTGITEKGAARPVAKDSEIRLEFLDGRLVVNAGCNTMSGNYVQDGSKLTVDPMAATQMACPPELMAQDDWLGKLFATPVKFTGAKEATLTSGEVVLKLADRRTVSPDRPLVGTAWTLNGLVSKDGVSSVPGEVTATLQIGKDGVASVNDSCNQGSGATTVAGDKITWAPRSLTRMACRGEDTATVQKAIGEILEGATTFAIEEKTLTVTKGDRALTFGADK